MRKRTSLERGEYIERILKRDSIRFEKSVTGDCIEWSLPDCPHSRWREIFDDSLALEEEVKSDAGIPVVTLATLQNKGKMRRLNILDGPVLLCQKDQEKFLL